MLTNSPHPLSRTAVEASVGLLDRGDRDVHGERDGGEEQRVAGLGLLLAPNLKRESEQLVRLALPTMAVSLFELLPNTLCVVLVGQFCSKEELVSASLGATFSNVFGLSLGLGFSSALVTLNSQAHGAGHDEMIGCYLQRAILLLSALLFFVILFNWFSATILIGLGQPRHVSEMASQFAHALLPSIPLIWAYDLLRKCLQAQEVTPWYLSAFSNLFTVLLAFVLLKYTDVGFIGAAVARSVGALFLFTAMLLYTRASNVYRTFWNGWSMERALEGLTDFIQLGIPGLVYMCLEWWAFEFVTLFAGLTVDPDEAIGANAICMQTTGLTFMVYLGFSIATNMRVGNHLGAGKPDKAHTAARVGVVLCALCGATMGLLLWCFAPLIATTFSPNSDSLQREVVRTLTWVALYQLPDAINTVCAGSLKGAGKQRLAVGISLCSYYIIGLPLGCILAFALPNHLLHDQLQSLWLGITIAIVIAAFLSSMQVFSIDWKNAADRVASMHLLD